MISEVGRVLGALRDGEVPALLIGGMACIVYGGKEFSKDADVVVACDDAAVSRLARVMAALGAEPIAVPPLSAQVLSKGHGVHFRLPPTPSLPQGLRVDVMGRLRDMDPFAVCWSRRLLLDLPGCGEVPVMALDDLLRSKRTERPQDWDDIRQLVEADCARITTQGTPTITDLHRWLRQGRTIDLLREAIRIADTYHAALASVRGERSVIDLACRGADDAALEAAMFNEYQDVATLHRAYWAPLLAELAAFRQAARFRKPEES